MKMICVLAGVLLWATPLLAETYSWVDEDGTCNFTEDYSRVPKKYRSKIDKRGDMGAPPVTMGAVSPGVAPLAASKNTSSEKSESTAGIFGGMSYDQWKQELSEREAAMRVTRNRVVEIDALMSKNPLNREQTQNLVAERNRAVEQFTEMRKQYDQQVELARKAGIQVNINQ